MKVIKTIKEFEKARVVRYIHTMDRVAIDQDNNVINITKNGLWDYKIGKLEDCIKNGWLITNKGVTK